MFSGRASPGPTGRRAYSTRETPALRDRTGFKEGGTKSRGCPCCPPYFFVLVDAPGSANFAACAASTLRYQYITIASSSRQVHVFLCTHCQPLDRPSSSSSFSSSFRVFLRSVNAYCNLTWLYSVHRCSSSSRDISVGVATGRGHLGQGCHWFLPSPKTRSRLSRRSYTSSELKRGEGWACVLIVEKWQEGRMF